MPGGRRLSDEEVRNELRRLRRLQSGGPGGGGTPGSGTATQVICSGAVNGINKIFTLPISPSSAASTLIFVGPLAQVQGSISEVGALTKDAYLSGTVITLARAPRRGYVWAFLVSSGALLRSTPTKLLTPKPGKSARRRRSITNRRRSPLKGRRLMRIHTITCELAITVLGTLLAFRPKDGTAIVPIRFTLKNKDQTTEERLNVVARRISAWGSPVKASAATIVNTPATLGDTFYGDVVAYCGEAGGTEPTTYEAGSDWAKTPGASNLNQPDVWKYEPPEADEQLARMLIADGAETRGIGIFLVAAPGATFVGLVEAVIGQWGTDATP